MSRTKHLTGLCQQCGEPISFPAEVIGTVAQCPRCGKQTELFLAPAPEDSSVSRKGKVWAVIAGVILVLGVAGPLAGLKQFQKWAAGKKEKAAAVAAARAADAAAQAGFNVSTITLEGAPGSAVVEAVGTVTNITSRQRFGVKVEFEFFDASGRRVGRGKAYKDRVEAGAQWEFRAPVSEPKAVSARLATVNEGQ